MRDDARVGDYMYFGTAIKDSKNGSIRENIVAVSVRVRNTPGELAIRCIDFWWIRGLV